METLCSFETFVSSKKIAQYHNSGDHNPEEKEECSGLLYCETYLQAGLHLPLFIPFRYQPGEVSRYSDGLRVGWSGFDSWQVQQIFVFSTTPRPALGSTQSPI
jgi:hypothetical protein